MIESPVTELPDAGGVEAVRHDDGEPGARGQDVAEAHVGPGEVGGLAHRARTVDHAGGRDTDAQHRRLGAVGQALDEVAEERDVRVEVVSSSAATEVARYASLLGQGRYAAAYLGIGLGRHLF